MPFWAGDCKVAQTIPGNASRLARLWRTGHFVEELTERLRLNSTGGAVEALSYGVGCSTRRGPSVGIPVEAIFYHLQALLAAKILEIPRIFCLVARNLACDRDSSCCLVDERATQHLRLIETLQGLLSVDLAQRVKTIRECELRGIDAYLQVRSEMPYVGAELEQSALKYFLEQHLLFQAMRREYAAGLKMGWSLLASSGSAERMVRALSTGSAPAHFCEAAFDSFTLADGHSDMSFLYVRPAGTFMPGMPNACPYSTSRVQGRILLGREESLRSIPAWNEHWSRDLKLQIANSAARLRRGLELADEMLEGGVGLSWSARLVSLEEEHHALEGDLRRNNASTVKRGKRFHRKAREVRILACRIAQESLKTINEPLRFLLRKFAVD